MVADKNDTLQITKVHFRQKGWCYKVRNSDLSDYVYIITLIGHNGYGSIPCRWCDFTLFCLIHTTISVSYSKKCPCLPYWNVSLSVLIKCVAVWFTEMYPSLIYWNMSQSDVWNVSLSGLLKHVPVCFAKMCPCLIYWNMSPSDLQKCIPVKFTENLPLSDVWNVSLSDLLKCVPVWFTEICPCLMFEMKWLSDLAETRDWPFIGAHVLDTLPSNYMIGNKTSSLQLSLSV